MRVHIIAAFSGLAILLASTSALAVAAAPDPRHQYKTYDPDAVYDLVIHPNHVLTVFFKKDEIVESVFSGDPKAWDIQISDSQKFVFIKTVLDVDQDKKKKTNLIVITNLRSYSFGLQLVSLEENPDIIYTIRFEKPEIPEEKKDDEKIILSASLGFEPEKPDPAPKKIEPSKPKAAPRRPVSRPRPVPALAPSCSASSAVASHSAPLPERPARNALAPVLWRWSTVSAEDEIWLTVQ